jgi:hypothetical protein
MFLLICVTLLDFVGIFSLFLIAPIALATCVVAGVITVGKKIRGGGRRWSRVVLALEVMRLLFMPVAKPSIFAFPGSPSVRLLPLFFMLLISTVFLEDW